MVLLQLEHCEGALACHQIRLLQLVVINHNTHFFHQVFHCKKTLNSVRDLAQFETFDGHSCPNLFRFLAEMCTESCFLFLSKPVGMTHNFMHKFSNLISSS